DDAIDLEAKLLRVQQGGPVEEALVTLLKQNHPDSVAILEVITPVYIQAYQLNSALECVRLWLEREPESVPAWQYRAQVYDRLLSTSELVASYRRILALDPENDQVRIQLAWQLHRSHHDQEALEQYQYLRPRLGDTPEVLCGIATCLGN